MDYKQMSINSKRELKERQKKEEDLADIFNEIKLKNYVVINDLNYIYLGKVIINNFNGISDDVYYIFNKNENIIKKLRVKRCGNRRRIYFYKHAMVEKDSLIYTSDNINNGLEYLKL